MTSPGSQDEAEQARAAWNARGGSGGADPAGQTPQEHMQPAPLEFRLGAFGAAFPMFVFVAWAVTVCTLGAPDAAGLIVGAIAGLAAAMFLCKSPWEEYAQQVFVGMSNPVGVVAIVAWLWAGMFAEVLQAGGLVEGLAWLGAEGGLHGGYFVGATFVLTALFAMAVGTGYGTTVAFCTLMYPAGLLLGADPLWLFASILSGAAFGDNLAPVSDTTIVSATTQHADVPGVVRSRVPYALTAALPALLIYVWVGGNGIADPEQAQSLLRQRTDPRGLVLLLPFVVVVSVALRGHHLVTSLTWGILLAIGLVLGLDLAPARDILYVDAQAGEMRGALVRGVAGYVEMAVLALLVVAAGHIMRVGGAMRRVVDSLLRFAGRSVARAELSSWSIVFAMNASITLNTAAEIAAAPFVREICSEFDVHRYRRANLLDATTSALGYIFPWSGGVLLGQETLVNLEEQYAFVEVIDATRVWPWVLHGWFLAAVMLTAAVTGLGRRYEGPNGEELTHPPRKGSSTGG